MKTISVLCGTDIFPVCAGHHRAIAALCKHLHKKDGVRIRFVLFTRERIKSPASYKEICDEFIQIPMPRRFSVYGALNKIISKFGPEILCNWFVGLALRKRIVAAVADSDDIIVNFTYWASLLPKELRKRKSIVATYDVISYRVASFRGNKTLIQRIRVACNRVLETAILRTFRKVIVLGKYEEKLLSDSGVSVNDILTIGMPIEVKAPLSLRQKFEYDFLTLGCNISQNVEGIRTFFSRVIPLIGDRRVTFAVIGNLCDNKLWTSHEVPSNVKIVRLGYVDDVSKECAKALIGVGTVPHGSGIKVKNVEMAMNGLAMLVTDSGEEGIPLDADATINIDRMAPDEVTRRLRVWLENPIKAAEYGQDQASRLRKEFSPAKMFKGLCDVLEVN